MEILRKVHDWILAGSITLVAAGLSWAGAQDPGRVEAWQGDLRTARDLVIARHPDPFQSMSEQELRQAFDDLIARAPQASDRELHCGLVRTMARIGDVHTGVVWKSLDLQAVPVHFSAFADGVYVMAISASHGDLLGGRFAGIGPHDVDAVLDALAAYLPEESEGSARRYAHQVLPVPELLAGAGLIEIEGPLIYRFTMPDGAERTYQPTVATSDLERMANLLDRDELGRRLPRSLRASAPYWLEKLDGGKTLYFQYNQVNDAPRGESLAAIFVRLFAALDAGGVERLVIDVRNNPGGTSHLSRPLIEGLSTRSDLEPGRLFVLLGPGTGSAAAQLVFALEKCTHAIFVGEPSGQGPVFYSDPETHTLEGTKITIRLARTRWVMSYEGDERGALEPDLLAPLSFDAFVAARDPGLEAIAAFDPSASEALLENVRARRARECDVQYYGQILRQGR